MNTKTRADFKVDFIIELKDALRQATQIGSGRVLTEAEVIKFTEVFKKNPMADKAKEALAAAQKMIAKAEQL